MNKKYILSEKTSNEWLTPLEIIRGLGEFDLDPSSPINRPWDTAKHHFTIKDDGLSQDWFGRVWMNPPYGNLTKSFIKKLKEHGNGIALIFARTDNKMFHEHIFGCADSIFFFGYRLNFYDVRGEKPSNNGGAPSVLVAYGNNNTKAIEKSGLKGYLVKL
jgi:hypothetical protein